MKFILKHRSTKSLRSGNNTGWPTIHHRKNWPRLPPKRSRGCSSFTIERIRAAIKRAPKNAARQAVKSNCLKRFVKPTAARLWPDMISKFTDANSLIIRSSELDARWRDASALTIGNDLVPVFTSLPEDPGDALKPRTWIECSLHPHGNREISARREPHPQGLVQPGPRAFQAARAATASWHAPAYRARRSGADLPDEPHPARGEPGARDRDPHPGARHLPPMAPDAALPRPPLGENAGHAGA